MFVCAGVPVEMADSISELIDSLQPEAVSFQGPSRHAAGYSGAARDPKRFNGDSNPSNVHAELPRHRVDAFDSPRGVKILRAD